VSGTLVVCATPIGNLEDVSLRALRVLGEADVVACEDTRRTRKLLTAHGIDAATLVPHHEHNEVEQTPNLLRRLEAGAKVVLVTDAGMPGIADPGYRIVRACLDAGIDVDAVPGPSALIDALVLSGLPVDRFVFEGFLPRKPTERRRRIEALAAEERTIVLYESPHRLGASLQDLAAALGPRPAVVARELTKVHQEIRRDPRGEVAVVVEGADPKPARSTPEEMARVAKTYMAEGVARSEALTRTARELGVRRREVFDALVGEGR
jgi:16S rRNA (cytidine1402-2'-O)-methyltransferase